MSSNIHIFLILLLFFITKKITTLLVIPFDRVNDIFSNDDIEVAKNIFSNDIYCNISIGKPSQSVPFLISFDKQATFISDKDFSFSKFDPKKSETFKKLSNENAKYVFENLESGYNVSDSFRIMNENYNLINIQNIPFILGTKLTKNFNFSASLGLKKKTYNNKNVFNFIENLKSKEIINSEVFSFKFFDDGTGELLIGSYPHEYDNNYDSADLVQSSSLEFGISNNWFLRINSVFYGEKMVFGGDKQELFDFTPEKGMIVLNKKMLDIIHDEFFSELIDQKKCIQIKISVNYYNFVCEDTIDLSTFKPISFIHIGMEYNFKFEAKDLFYHYYDRYFFLVAFGDTMYIHLGKPFFKKYNLFFNQDSKQLSLYSKISNNNTNMNKIKNSLPLILIIILSLMVLYLGRKLYIYKVKKIKVNEIIEDFDYNKQTESKSKMLEMTVPR